MILLSSITTLIYLSASILYLLAIIGKRQSAARVGRWLMLTGVVIHAAYFGVSHSTTETVPVASLNELFSFFAWCLVLLFLLLDLRFRLSVMGIFAAFLAFLLMAVSTLSPDVIVSLSPVLQSWFFPVHVTLSFLGIAAFALSFSAGVLYLVQNRMLKSKRFTGVYRLLPSLASLDKVNHTCLSVGFPLLTLGIISGAFWSYTVWGTYWRWDPKETLALLTWFMYAALLHGRLTLVWQGRRAAIFSIIAFIFLVFVFFGVSLLFGSFHALEVL